MLNNGGVKTTKGIAPVQILVNPQFQFSMGVVVSKECKSVVTENGRKILKAGTPLTGSLDARTSAFTEAATSDGKSNAVGILLHDVDITESNANGTLLIFGFVNTNRINVTAKALITDEVKAALNKVTFVAC